MPTPELSGVSVVALGAFNPAIFHPRWLSSRELIPEAMAEAAENSSIGDQAAQFMISPQLAVFVADWLTVQVTPQQALFATVDEGREQDLRDFVKGVFDLLPETPATALGINSDTHFRSMSEDAWHNFGDQFLPKQFWEPLFEEDGWKQRKSGERVGMRLMTVEATRDSDDEPGRVNIQLAPSTRIGPFGIYIGINSHFDLKERDGFRATAGDASKTLMDQWDRARALEVRLVERLLREI